MKWRAVHKDIVGGLDVERLLNLGVWSDNEVKEDEGWDEEVEPPIWLDGKPQCACECESVYEEGQKTYPIQRLASWCSVQCFTSCWKCDDEMKRFEIRLLLLTVCKGSSVR